MSRLATGVLLRQIHRLVHGNTPVPGTDAEVTALPERYRGPVILCWLEGQTQEEAARLLQTSHSTLRRRLEQGKHLLKARLARRGLVPVAALAGSVLCPKVAEAMPPRFL